MKKLLGLLLIIVGIFILFHMFFNQQIDFAWFDKGKSSHQSAAVDGIDHIKVDASALRVRIISADRNKVTADLQGKGRLDMGRNGDTLKINVKHRWFNWIPFGGSTKLDVYVPENYNQNMAIRSGSGSMELSGTSKNHPMTLDQLDIKMSSGKGNLRNLKVQQLSANGSSGELNLNNLTAKTTDLDFSSGKVELKHYVGALDGKFSSGMIKAQFDQLKGPIDLDASSGLVSVDLPDKGNFTLNADASSGMIHCNLPLKNMTINEHNHVKGSSGTGKYDVNVKVSSGIARIH